jgi:hypothetical protein
VIIKHRNSGKIVKECFYGTIDFIETAELDKFSLPQAADLKERASGRQDLDT